MAKKILIVEDDAELAQVLRIILEEAGFQVFHSSDAYGGTQLAHKQRPDLIVLDIIMPAGGGFNVLRRLKESMHTNGIPVIVTTGTQDAEFEKEARRLGVKDYMHKPYSCKELLDKITNILS
ncbi:MAG: response regulator transcription factor [Candidatus Orphnella occulta]|nr:response regulator transcription factor [Candidatus Orphnella occulta]